MLLFFNGPPKSQVLKTALFLGCILQLPRSVNGANPNKESHHDVVDLQQGSVFHIDLFEDSEFGKALPCKCCSSTTRRGCSWLSNISHIKDSQGARNPPTKELLLKDPRLSMPITKIRM